jgi:hypothetical protein
MKDKTELYMTDLYQECIKHMDENQIQEFKFLITIGLMLKRFQGEIKNTRSVIDEIIIELVDKKEQ